MGKPIGKFDALVRAVRLSAELADADVDAVMNGFHYLIDGLKAEAWDEGWDAGYQYGLSMYGEYRTENPYREETK